MAPSLVGLAFTGEPNELPCQVCTCTKGMHAAVDPLPLAPLCTRAQAPEWCQSSRPDLALCQDMGFSNEAMRDRCGQDMWAAHDTCMHRVLSGGGDPCIALASATVANAPLRLMPWVSDVLRQACATMHGGTPGTPDAQCRHLERAIFQEIVRSDLIAGGTGHS